MKTSTKARLTKADRKSIDHSYELINAVFQVRGSKHWSQKPENLCALKYVRLTHGRSRGSVIAELTAQVVEDHRTSDVKFMFWADTYTAEGGSPQEFKPEARS